MSGVSIASSSNLFLNFLKDSILHSCQSSLFRSQLVYGKKDCLNPFVLQQYVPIESVERVSYVLFLRSINLQQYLDTSWDFYFTKCINLVDQFLNCNKSFEICDSMLFKNLYVAPLVLTIQEELRDILQLSPLNI